MTLSFDPKSILTIGIAYWYLHWIGIFCVKYERNRSKNEGGIRVTTSKT